MLSLLGKANCWYCTWVLIAFSFSFQWLFMVSLWKSRRNPIAHVQNLAPLAVKSSHSSSVMGKSACTMSGKVIRSMFAVRTAGFNEDWRKSNKAITEILEKLPLQQITDWWDNAFSWWTLMDLFTVVSNTYIIILKQCFSSKCTSSIPPAWELARV